MKKLDIDFAITGKPDTRFLKKLGYDTHRTKKGFYIENNIKLDVYEYKTIDNSDIVESEAIISEYLSEFS